MNAVQTIRDWHCPTGDPYYSPRLQRGEMDRASIETVLDICGDRDNFAVDGGAHIGTWSRPLAEHFAEVIAFEPHPTLACLFRANVPHVRLIEAALWKKCTILGLKAGEINSGQAFVTQGNDHASMAHVPAVALDNFEYPELDLLKLDVEGAELYALQGAVKTITRCRPVVVIEQNVASERFKLPKGAAANWLLNVGMHEVARVEFADDEFNVIFDWDG